jgi:ATP-binding cassette subfamily B (MDR/TAP) protein 1
LYPVQSVLYAKTVDAFQKHGHELRSAGNFWGLMWFILALIVAFGYFGIGSVGVGLGEVFPVSEISVANAS